MNTQCAPITSFPDVHCSDVSNTITHVLYNPETGIVMGYDKNIIGRGEIVHGILKITPIPKPLP